tara:strand:+ start:31262 stop:32458 length:1197 start_codon:yes stop_codon:yes gene_type:complete
MKIPHKQLGYYTCDSKIFTSKIHACIHATQTKKDLQWHFNDEVFDNFPWHIEPHETLDDLYFQRAKQLREKYDYICLAFSGGGDSNNILEAFLRQGLFIDEVVTNVMEDLNHMTTVNPYEINNWNEGAEYKLQTEGRLKELHKRSPNTKISVIDLSTGLFNLFNSYGDAGWIEKTRERMNPSGFMRHNFLHMAEIRKRFDKDKKICMLLGIEKPRTYIKGNTFKMCFSDKACNIATVSEFVEDYDNTAIEYFYWSPEGAPIIAKQCHVIKKFIEGNPNYMRYWKPKNIGEIWSNHRKYHERILRPLIYNSTWADNFWQANKSTKDWYSEIDDWFWTNHKDSKEHAIWRAGLDYVKENAKDWMMPGDVEGLKGFLKAYEIGEMNPIKLELPTNNAVLVD